MSTIIAVDHGNDAIKTENFHFKSSLTDHMIPPPLESEILEFDGTFYTLSGERIPYMRDKTKDDRFFVLTLFAIAKELERRGDIKGITHIDLAVGLPPEHFSKQKERFTRYFSRDGFINFVYKDVPMSIMVNQVAIFAQAHAAIAPMFGEMRKTPQMFLVDIGGYTTDVLLLRHGAPDLNFCRSLETGIITMNNRLIGKVNASHDMMINDTHIMSVLNHEQTILPGDVLETIRLAAGQHARDILDKLRELGVDLRSNPAVFIGGGSVLLQPYIEQSEQVASARFVEDVKANAVGYRMLMAAKLKSTSV